MNVSNSLATLSLCFAMAMPNAEPLYAQGEVGEEKIAEIKPLGDKFHRITLTDSRLTFIDENGKYKDEHVVGPTWHAEFKRSPLIEGGETETIVWERFSIYSAYLTMLEGAEQDVFISLEEVEKGVDALMQQPCTADEFRYYSRALDFGLAYKYFQREGDVIENRFTVHDICLTFG